MIPDRDVWAAALLMVKRFGNDAMLEAAARADELLENGDMIGKRDVAPDPQTDRAVTGQGAGGWEGVH
jgi:hypothetical protein